MAKQLGLHGVRGRVISALACPQNRWNTFHCLKRINTHSIQRNDDVWGFRDAGNGNWPAMVTGGFHHSLKLARACFRSGSGFVNHVESYK